MNCSFNTHKAIYGPVTRLKWLFKVSKIKLNQRPTTSEVITCYIRLTNYPYWTSFFVPYSSILNDHYAFSSFNWLVDGHNYQILRTGCYPFIKYHCTKKEAENMSAQNKLFNMIKVVNLGIIILINSEFNGFYHLLYFFQQFLVSLMAWPQFF